jgi:hypothetical protein
VGSYIYITILYIIITIYSIYYTYILIYIPGYSQVTVGVESSQNARSLGHCLRDW